MKNFETTNLCKAFNGQEVVSNISLNIEENSIYGLLGPNGAGKSTILKNGYRHFETNIRKN